MSLLTIALFALGYVIVLLFVLVLLKAARRADEAAEREYEAVLRALTEDGRIVQLSDDDPAREIVLRRRAG